MDHQKKYSSSKFSGVWLIVLLLLILVLASIALLGSFIKRYAAQEKNIIDVLADSNEIKDKYDDDDLPVGANPDLVPSWETSTSVDLFKNTYTDAEGNITVQSHDGGKVIAPGTSNSYEFNLKNTGNISLDYTLVLEGIFKISEHRLPFYVRLYQGDRWLIGGENEWIHGDLAKTLVEKSTLPSGKSVTYIFEWQWPYEADDESQKLIDDFNDTLISADRNDTNIGSVAVGANAEFRLNISTTAVVTPGADPVRGDGTRILDELIFNSLMTGLILFSGIWLILIFWRRKLYFTGLITPAFAGEVKLGKAKDSVLNNRFIFPKARYGKRELKIEDAVLKIRFKARRVKEGIRFEQDDDRAVIVVGRQIRAVELHFTYAKGKLTVSRGNWAAIDKKHNVYTEGGITEPVCDRNITPDGLCIDEDNKLFIGKAEGFINGKKH